MQEFISFIRKIEITKFFMDLFVLEIYILKINNTYNTNAKKFKKLFPAKVLLYKSKIKNNFLLLHNY